jgi:uridine phosphorylase
MTTQTRFAHHLGLSAADIKDARIALLPGDPFRVPPIANSLSDAKELAFHREFRSHLGFLNGKPILVTSTGCGGPSLSVCVEELAQIGVHTFIRVGTCGAIQEHIEPGDLVISTAAVRLEGASRSFAPIEYPAVADFEVTTALLESARESGARFHLGITASTDTFYPGQERYDTFTGHVPAHLRGSLVEWRALKVANFEMESATLFTMCATMGLAAGSVCGVVAKRAASEKIASKAVFEEAERRTIEIAVKAAGALASIKG